MKISIIISVYNKLNQLNSILEAFNNQTELPFEILIVDDGSSENLEKAIGNIIPKLNYNLKHIYQEDKGFRLAASRNNGILNASGDYIFFIDQDILFDENFVKNMKESINGKDVLKLIVVSLDRERTEIINKKIENNKNFKHQYIEEELRLKDKKLINKKKRKDFIRNFRYKLKITKRGAKVIGLGIGTTKENLFKINGFDERYEGWGHEDDDLGNRLYALGLGVKNIELDKLAVHMFHPTNNSGVSINQDYYDKTKKIIYKYKKYKCEYGLDNRLVKEEIIVKKIK